MRVVEHMFRWRDWELIRTTLDYLKLDAQTVEFRVPVEADGEAQADYTVRYEW